MSAPIKREDHDQYDKEGAMAANEMNGKTQHEGREREYPSAIHKEMGKTHAEVIDQLAAQGDTPKSALAVFEDVVRSVKAAMAPRPRAGAVDPIALSSAIGITMEESIAYFDEAVAAGRGSHSDGGAFARPASLADFFGKREWSSVIAVRVEGQSMKDDNIVDGDVVVVDTKRAPKDGDIVLAHVGGRGQVVKRLRITRFGGVVLESANVDFAPIVIDDVEGLTIHGVVVARGGEL